MLSPWLAPNTANCCIKLRHVILFAAFFFASYTAIAQTKSHKEILSVMALQNTAWNNGDIEGFMQTYWKNDSLVFAGKNGVTYGWQNTFNNYKKSYPDKATMGVLSFNILKVQKLSSKCYNVIGKWHLKRNMGDVGGYFTLLFKKINGQWLIIQDHTS